MYGREHMLAGFPHLYYYGKPQIAKAFLQECSRYATAKPVKRLTMGKKERE